MADGLHVCAVLVFIAAVGGAGILSAKGFYCRDPDTGKLYPINATWPSESFCGSYTCRIRKRNLTDYEYLPFRKFNLTLGDVITKNETESSINNTSDSNNAESVLNEIKIELTAPNSGSNSKNIENQEDVESVALRKLKELQAMSENGDRYLTNPEIRALTDLIHSVKKSDIEAIIEIYNIAKDIYKEVDKTADEHILEETMKDISQNSDDIRKAMGQNNIKPISYWYEPLTVSNNKVKAAEDIKPFEPIIKEKSDLYNEGSNAINTQSMPYLNAFHRDFSKLPYYYPMSSFQRLSSYIHQPYSNTPYVPAGVENKPCKKKEHYSPWNSLLIKKPIEPPKKGPSDQKPVFLPLPFAYVHHYNTSKAVGPYYINENPWANVEFYSQPQNNIPSYVNAAYITQIPNAVLINPNLNDKVQNIQQKPTEQQNIPKQENLVNVLDDLSKNKPKKNLEWQTDDLPTSVLDEIRANMLSKSKLFPFPLRKKVKLERVGKVIKIEEHSRSKRETSDEKPSEVYEGYDVYLEKNTCQLENEPGFFRVGNLTEPFPACCPQRIGKR